MKEKILLHPKQHEAMNFCALHYPVVFKRNKKPAKGRWLLKNFAILPFFCIFLSARVAAQKITINEKEASLKEIFGLIKKQTGYTFLYEKGLLDTAGTVTINVKDAEIREVLDMCFNGKPLAYIISGNIIGIKRKKAATPTPTSPSFQLVIPEDSLIHGFVRSAGGSPLIGVTVTDVALKERSRRTVITNPDGNFEIKGKKGDRLLFTTIGYEKKEIKYNSERLLNITMEEETVLLNDVTVNNTDFSRKKIPWTDTIDMTHRSHLNLGQLLQGTIPGLTLQNSSQSQQTIASLTTNGITFSVDNLRSYYNAMQSSYAAIGINSFEALLSSLQSAGQYSPTYTTSVNSNGLVPQLRGVGGFNGNTLGMLIVIDGFPQDGFPADYPMTNVESVKVIKDPEELTKWGPKAAGGAIIITSKRAVAGKLQLSYSSNFYYSPAPRFNRNKQQLASSTQILDYMKDASDSGFLIFNTDNYAPLFNLNPAEYLLHGLQSGSLPSSIFNTSWDSLSKLDNQSQLRLLQQNIFNQNHLLTLRGGSRAWRFTATGNYATSRTAALGNYNHTTGLNMNNKFALLHNKLNIDWQLIIASSKARAGYNFDPNSTPLQPYQLLVDKRGNYIYDYSTFNPDANDTIKRYGYEEYGVNLLQDARVNSNITKTLQMQSMLNTDWELLHGLKWSNSFQYTLAKSKTENLQDAESSAARQLIDNYGSPLIDANGNVTGINFYVPKGGIFQQYSTKVTNWNLRSALLFNRDFGKHHLSLALGGGGSDNSSNTPAYATVYGYDPKTGKGQPIQLPTPDPTAEIINFYGLPGNSFWSNTASQLPYPYTLLAPNAGSNSVSRTINWNGSLKYAYDDTYILKGSYNATLSPNYGYSPPYTTFANYNADATWRLNKHSFFHIPKWISNLSLSSGITGVKVPDLPVQISASRALQTDWNNYGIWVGSYNPAQQNGQSIYNIYQKLTLGLDDDRFVFDVSYNTQNTRSAVGNTDSSSTQRFFGAGAKIKLRKGLLNLIGNYGRSPEGQAQTNLRAMYNIAKESYFYSKVISSLSADFILQDISAYQSMELMAETNTPEAGGGFSMAVNSNFGLLPPKIKNAEAHATIGFLKDRYLLDLRYYRKTTSGLNNNVPVPTDPSTGLGAQVTYSQIVNRGIELYLVIKAVEQKNFSYRITLNGAYNKNIAQSVPLVNFSQTTGYLTAYRNGYSTENLWSYRWAGLDNKGNPQIYDTKGQKTANPDSATLASALVYSGVTRAPYTGGFIQEWNFKDFFARATLLLNMGHVMREYIPSPSGSLDNSSLISKRWEKPGDEATTDVPAMANTSATSTRTFITQNATNSIMPADNIRLQEIQVGWQSPKKMLQNFFIRDLTLSFQMQNVAVWTRNKLHVDPETVASGGQIGLPMPRQYSFSVNMRF